MITKSFVIRPSLLMMSAGFVLFASGDRCLSQDVEQNGNEVRRIQILLGAEGLDVVSPALNGSESGPTETPMLPPGTESLSELYSSDNPGIGRRTLNPLRLQSARRSSPDTKYFREQISQQIDFLAQQGNDVQQLRELVERLQFAQENSEQRTTRDVEVAVFAVPEAVQEGREGPFAEDRKRIAALTESAERITQAGLPEVAQGLRERAGQLERELAEKQERMQQEERKRMESAVRERQEQARQQLRIHQPQRLMEQRRDGVARGDQPAPPIRELHEQMEQLRRDMHKLSEQLADLTRLIQQHHNPRTDRGHHGEMNDDEDGDDHEKDGDDDGSPDHKDREEHEKE